MRLTTEQYKIILARQQASKPIPERVPEPTKVSREKEIHEEIVAYCRSKGWWAAHSRMDHKTGRPLGEPDFTIYMDGGRRLMVEVKKPGGKLSAEQQQTIALLGKLGHTVHVITSIEEFYELARG